MHLIITLVVPIALVSSLAVADPAAHRRTAERVAGMVSDRNAQALAREHGLDVVNVMWEDTGRWQGSALGPNISDVTIEVESEGANNAARTHLMPVLRYPNFSDETADVKLDEFFVRVGNERGDDLQPVSVSELLENPGRYLSSPFEGSIEGGTLLAERDTHALVSAQHAFLPIGTGTTRFWPVVFNYQSRRGQPAVLTILATRQGTSMTIIDNSRDTVRGSRGQRLYFNSAGERAPLLAERLSEVQARGTTHNDESAESLGDDANVLLLVQVPLKIERPRRQVMSPDDTGAMPEPMESAAPLASRSSGHSDVETAVVGHGPTEGPYTELDGLTIERDPRFPVRVTVQFYQATSNGIVEGEDFAQMAGQVDEVYRRGDYVGSLVVPDRSDLERPTNWDGVTGAPIGLTWRDFPGLVERYADLGLGPLRRVLLAR